MANNTGTPALTNPVWLGDRLVAADEATIHITDHGFTVGDGVFETIAVRGGTAVARDRHIARLMWCAEKILMSPPEPESVNRAIDQVISAADDHTHMSGRLRITWTSGGGPLGSARGGGPGTLVVFAAASAPWPKHSRLALSPWTHNERSPLAGVKSTSYADNVVALTWAQAQGADEALLLDTRGNVCEGTGSNVLISVDGELITPSLSTGCLAGITRALVLETSSVREVECGEDVLHRAQGIAVLSSTRDIHPVNWLRLGDGSVREFPAEDPLIEAAGNALQELYAGNLNP
jgi:branched-chain amino acid aminotransferase